MKQRLRYAWEDFSFTTVALAALCTHVFVALMGKWDAMLIWLAPLTAFVVEFALNYFRAWVDEDEKPLDKCKK